MNDSPPTCHICGRPIEVRYCSPCYSPCSSVNLGYWSHLPTVAGVDADQDHEALR